MQREPLLLPSLALAGGVFLAHFIFFKPADLALPSVVCGAAIVLALIAGCGKTARWALTCTACALVGIWVQVAHRQTRTPRLNAEDGEVVLLSGCIVTPPALSADREQFVIELAPQAKARVSVGLKPAQRLQLTYGERVELPAKIRYPRNYENPGSFDFAGYLASQHIYWTAFVSSPAAIRVVGACGSPILKQIFQVRSWALDRLRILYPNDSHTAALLAATLIGETAGVERRWTNDFRVTGTYHALVISGLHVSIVAMALLIFLRLLWMPRLLALWVSTGVCWLYAVLAGFHAPAVRASAGFMLFVIAATMFRRARALNLLALIGIVYLLYDPDQLFDASFQLSFLSVALIAVFARPAMDRFTAPLRAAVRHFSQRRYDPQLPPRAAQWRVELRLVAETLRVWMRIPEPIALGLVACAVIMSAFALDVVIVSACIQFGLALPMIVYFHRLSITGISANIMVVPLLSLVVPLGFAAILTGSHLLALATKSLLVWSETIAAWHVRWEPEWRIGWLPLWLAIAFSCSLVVLAIAIRCRPRWVIPALAGSLALFTWICLQPWKPETHPGMLEVTAIDVSQGDSLLVVFPNSETMLVDAGGFPGLGRMTRKPQLDVGEDVVSPYLWSRRIHHLDYAVLTHGHSDHMGGLAAILDNFQPKALWIGAEPATPEWRDMEAHAVADRVAIVALNRNSAPITIGGAQIRVLAPSPDYVPGESAHNNDSLVLEITYGRRAVLLTGDAESPIEADLAASGLLHPVTLLKVGHHGSRTSSSNQLLDQIQPQIAFISDGYMNQFHHPNPDVLKRLAQHHAAVYRTDQHGLLTFLTDGSRVEVETFH